MNSLHAKLHCCHMRLIAVRYASSTNNFNYQFIQNSKIPTLHFQKSLPHLPIPKLDKTCERYLAAQRPLLINEAYSKTEANVQQFKTTSGRVLHDILKAHDKKNKHTSYISEPWFDMYLRSRQPLPINCNPVLVFENDPNNNSTQLIRSSNMVISSLRFMKSLKNGILNPEVFHLNPKKSDTNLFRTVTSMMPASLSWYAAYMFNAYPLDMSQYNSLFNSSRIPEIDKDWLFQGTDAKHIMVMRRGNIYAVDVLDESGDILPANVIFARVQHVLKDDRPPAQYPIGIFTTEDRDKWASLRHHLSHIGNEKNLKMIDSALFNLVLDDDMVGDDFLKMTRNFMHGNGKNRWFDKSFSLMFSKDGIGAVNFEHSWGDGVAVLKYFQDIYKDSVNNMQIDSESRPDSIDLEKSVRNINIIIDDKIKSAVDESVQNFKKICDSLDVKYLISENLGKNFVKKQNLSPDAIMQLGFQAAYFKQKGKFTGSYESCSTAAFKHGRTETIRPCTIFTQAYCDAVHSKNKPSNTQLRAMIKDCSNKHVTLTTEAAMGQGFDRHLFALNYLAEKKGLPKPSIFEDPAYNTINHNVISTSTLSSPEVQSGGFGPVVPNGYGIAYMIRDDRMGTVVTSYPSHCDGNDFINCLKTSYDEIREILQN